MNSPPNWEELLDIDDSDLRLSATTQPDIRLSATTQNIFSYENPVVENCAETPVRITQGPAGMVQSANDGVMATQEYVRKVVHDVGDDPDFTSEPWFRAVEYMKPDGGIMIGYFADIEKFIKKGKLEKCVGIIKTCTPNVLGDLTVTMKDVSGFISGGIHHKVVNDERFEKKLVVGAVLVLHNVSVFSPKQSANHYLCITLKNIVKIFNNDTVPNDVCGVGSQGSVTLV